MYPIRGSGTDYKTSHKALGAGSNNVPFPLLQEMIITELQAETTYSVAVAAYTTKGDGARSKPKLITTTGAGRWELCACTLGPPLDTFSPPPGGVGREMFFLFHLGG